MEPVQDVLQVIAEHLESWLEGDELALESLGEALQERGATADQIHAAILALRSLAGAGAGAGVAATLDEAPERREHRFLIEDGGSDGEVAH
jgi:hypothetical protein